MNRVSLGLSILLLGACTSSAPEMEMDISNSANPRTAILVMAPAYEQELLLSGALARSAAADGITTLIYMNREGGTFSPGQNNSITNRSTVISQTVVLPPAVVSDPDWAIAMECMSEIFSDFNVAFTDVDPGNMPHYESVVTTSAAVLGLNAEFAGYSPLTSNCDVIPNSVVFTFAEVVPSPTEICRVAAQEIAHSIGLDHEFLCEDPMTYLAGCGAKSFQDVSAPCGEYEPRACVVSGQYNCGRTEQNSFQLLSERLGLHILEVDIATPVDAATVFAGFEIRAKAVRPDTLVLQLDGVHIAMTDASPAVFVAPADLALGSHLVEVIATRGEETSSSSVNVTIVEEKDDGYFDENSPKSHSPEDTSGSDLKGGCSSSTGASGFPLALLFLSLVSIERTRRAHSMVD